VVSDLSMFGASVRHQGRSRWWHRPRPRHVTMTVTDTDEVDPQLDAADLRTCAGGHSTTAPARRQGHPFNGRGTQWSLADLTGGRAPPQPRARPGEITRSPGRSLGATPRPVHGRHHHRQHQILTP
jgi:hypothetical protein